MDNQFLPIEPKKDTSVVNKRQIDRSAISKAIYMVTDFFDKDEPLKHALRKVSVGMLTDNNLEHLEKLRSLLVLSKDMEFLSEANYDIFIRALFDMEVRDINLKHNIDISDSLKIVHSDSASIQSDYRSTDQSKVVPSTSGIKDTVVPSTSIYKTPIAGNLLKKEGEKQTGGMTALTTLDIGTRRKKILEVVKSKGQATIHEFTQSIQGCSSKTIQRELTSLVLSGTLKKTGERRWSKYSLR